MNQSESGRPVVSVLSTLRVLEEVAQHQPVGVSELARGLGMPKSSVQRCLVTLQHAGWLRMVDPDRSRWGVTTKPLGIGLRAAGEEGLREVAQPFLTELRDATGETIHLAVRDGNSLVILARRDSLQAVRTFVEVGTRAPLHATSCGLAIMAKMTDAEIEGVLHGDLKRFTETTIVRRPALLDEVRRTRERGYAVNEASWWRPEVSAIGVAITGASGRPVAALAVSIPASRFEPERVPFYGSCAVKAAQQISEALQQL